MSINTPEEREAHERQIAAKAANREHLLVPAMMVGWAYWAYWLLLHYHFLTIYFAGR